MKKLFLALIAGVLILSSCNKSKQFKVTLNLDNADGKTVYFSKIVDGETIEIDSAVIEGKKAVFTADFDDPLIEYTIKFSKGDKCDVFPLFTENKNTTISGNLDDIGHWTVKGGPIMEEWNTYRESILPMEEQIMAVYNEANDKYLAGDTSQVAELMGQVQTMMDEYTNVRLDYIKKNPNNFLAQYLLDKEKDDYEFEDVREVAKSFTTESVYTKNINEYVRKNERVQVGQPFIDFTLQTADGKDVNLAETIKKNKLTLVDFWASWCGPCRDENPFVKVAYEKFHKKGLEIIGVSCDKYEVSWTKAVEADALPYIQVRDIEKTVSEDYLIVYIPSNFLFDQNGVIIAKNLRGEELEAKLAEMLK